MALYLGSTKVGEMYLGSTKIGQAYLGSTLVYTSTQPPAPTVPAGLIEPFAGSTVPTGFLLCDGTAVSRTTYATLYAVIGDTFGAGDGSSTFNLPDLSGRVPLGASMSHALGTTGGSETVTLTVSELPSHMHEVPQHGHADTIGAATPAFTHIITQPVFAYNKANTGTTSLNSASTRNPCISSSATGWTATRTTDVSVGNHAATACTVSGSIANAAAFDSNSIGGNLSHNNMQPFIAMVYIISTGE